MCCALPFVDLISLQNLADRADGQILTGPF
jgi:hypothetical protein